ncbi:hypothetical protein M0805_005630 [Coniferiporia weirii]|nr:hypothetical protein M0805_005630 [Coniferiporia weirii]
MICTTPFSSAAAGPSTPRRTVQPASSPCACAARLTRPSPSPARALSPQELYLRALEREREEILAEAYATKTPSIPPRHYLDVDMDVDMDDTDTEDAPCSCTTSRRSDFRETVRQRQARLESLRRLEFARRLAHKGLEDAAASEYAIKRLPPPRVRPIERVNAAIKIQRAFRAHLARVAQAAREEETIVSIEEVDEDEYYDEDSDFETESDSSLDTDCGLGYSYAPRSPYHSPNASSARLYVVAEEDEEDEDEDDCAVTTGRAAALAALFAEAQAKQQRRLRDSRRPLVMPVTPHSPTRSPVARSPSLESISEDAECVDVC